MSRSIRTKKGQTLTFSADPGNQWYRRKRKRKKVKPFGTLAEAKTKIPKSHKRHPLKFLYHSTDTDGTAYIFKCSCGKRFSVWIHNPNAIIWKEMNEGQ